MSKTCIVEKQDRRITSVRTFAGLRSKLYDKIASIPIMGNRDQAFSYLQKVYSEKFLKKFGDWTAESKIPAAMGALREESIALQEENGTNEMIKAAGEAANTLNTPVIIVTRDSVKSAVRNGEIRSKMLESKGWYDPSTGEVFIVVDNHENRADIEKTLMHEVVAHKGLRELLGERFGETMDEVFAAMTQSDKNAYMERYGDERVAAEEYLAHMAEAEIEHSVLQRILSAIRKTLRDMGFTLEMNETDIQDLLVRSRENLTEMDKEIAKPAAENGVVKGETYPETGEPRLFFRDAKDNLYDSYGEALRSENREIEAGFTTAKIADGVDISETAEGVKLNNPDAFIPVMRFKVSANPRTPQGAINYLIKKGYLHEEKVFDRDERTYRLTGKGFSSDNRINNAISSYYLLSNLLGQHNVEMNEDGLIRVSNRNRNAVQMMENGKPVTVNKEEILQALEEGRYEELSRRYENMDMMVVSLFFENADVFGGSRPSFTSRGDKTSQLRLRIVDMLKTFGIRVVGMTDYLERYGAKHGADPSVKALADMANGVIAVAEGASLSDVAEEVSHFMVEAYQDQDAVSEAMREVEGTEEWNTYASEYYMTYSKVYSGEALENAVRREILGKVLKNRILGEETQPNVFTRLIQGIQNFLRQMFTGQRSTMDRIMQDMEGAFLSGDKTQFDTSLLAESTFTLYSTEQKKEGYDLQRTIESLKRVLRNFRQTRAEIASNVNNTLSEIERIERDIRDAETKLEGKEVDMAATSLLSSMEAQVAYIENLVSETEKNSEFMKPSDRMNIQTVNSQMEPIILQLRTFLKNTSDLDPGKKKALMRRTDDVLARLSAANADIEGITSKADENFINKFLSKFGITGDLAKSIKKLIYAVNKDISWLARMYGTLERCGNMVNKALGAVISRNNQNAIVNTQIEGKELLEFAQKEGITVSDWENILQKNPDGSYSSFIIDERDNAKFDYERRIEQVKALREIMNLKDLTDEQIEELVAKGSPYEFKYDTVENGVTVEKKFKFLPSNTRAVMDFLSAEDELKYRRKMSEWDSVHRERMFKDEYYKKQDEFYENVEKFINKGLSPDNPKYKRISDETKTFLQNFYRERAIQMAKFVEKDPATGKITGFRAADWRRSASREAVMHLEKAKRQAESKYIYIGANRELKTGSQLRLAEDLGHIRDYYRSTGGDQRVTAQRFFDEVEKMKTERSKGQTSNSDILNYITSGGTLSFSEKFWDSLPAFDAEGNQTAYRQIANAIVIKSPGKVDTVNGLADAIKNDYDSVREIVRFNRDMTRPGNIDYDMMTKSEIDAIKEIQERISGNIRKLYSEASQEGVDVRKYQNRDRASETDFNDSFEDLYKDYAAEKPEKVSRWEFAKRHMLLASRNKVDTLAQKLSLGSKNKFSFTEAETRTIARFLNIDPAIESADFRRLVGQEMDKASGKEKIEKIMDAYAARFVFPYFKRTQPTGYGEFMRAAMSDASFDWTGFLRAIENGTTFSAQAPSTELSGMPSGKVTFDCSMLSFNPNKQAMDEEASFADMLNPDYDNTGKYGMMQPKKSLYRNREYENRFGRITMGQDGKRHAERNDKEFQMIELLLRMKRLSLGNYNATNRYSMLEIPQASQTALERGGGLFTNTKQTLGNWLKDKTMDRVDDSNYGNTVDGQESSEEDRVKIMPKYYLNRLEDQSDVSHDLTNTYINMLFQSYLYKAKQESLDEVMGLQNVLLNTKFEGGKKPSETNTYEMFKDFMDAYFFGIHSNTKRIAKNILGYQVDVTKIMNTLEGFGRVMNLALSPAVAFTGAVTGQVNHLIEGFTGQYFDRDSMLFADKEMARTLPDLINEIGDIDRNSKFYLMGEQMGIFNMQSRMFGAGFSKGLRLGFRDPLFKPMEILAYPLGPQTMYAVLDSFRYYNGKFMDKKEFMSLNKGNANAENEWVALRPKSLYNQGEAKDGKLTWSLKLFEGVDGETAQERMNQALLNARMRTRSVSQIINGQLNDENRLGASRNWGLRFTTAHRGWLSLTAQRLWGRRGYNFQTQQIEEGLTVSLGNFVKRMVDASGEKGFMNLIGMYNAAKGKMDDVERQNMKRFLVYACTFGIFNFLSALLFGWRDDDDNDDNWLVQFTSYIGMRTINEIASQMPVFFASNLVDIISDPFVMMNKLRDFTDLRNFSFDEVTSGTYKGSPYIWRTFCKNTFLKQLYNFRTAEATRRSSEWWRQTNRATMAFFWGASRSRQKMDDINWWDQ